MKMIFYEPIPIWVAMLLGDLVYMFIKHHVKMEYPIECHVLENYAEFTYRK